MPRLISHTGRALREKQLFYDRVIGLDKLTEGDASRGVDYTIEASELVVGGRDECISAAGIAQVERDGACACDSEVVEAFRIARRAYEASAAFGRTTRDRRTEPAARADNGYDWPVKIRGQCEMLRGIGRGTPMRTSTPGDQRAIGTPRGARNPAASTSDSSQSSTSAAYSGHGGCATLAHIRRRPNVVPSAHRALRKWSSSLRSEPIRRAPMRTAMLLVASAPGQRRVDV